MNYERIYWELIEHRKVMPRLEDVYYECHHILPKSLGGTDDPENLIYLTAEEHFLAHMLLAKMHGGAMWHAAQAMTMKRDGVIIKKRRLVAILRKARADMLRDKTVYQIKNLKTGGIFEGTREEIRKITGMVKNDVQCLVTGYCYKVKGYALTSTDLSFLEPQKFIFVNIDTGEQIRASYYEMADTTGGDFTSFHQLIKGKTKIAKGYTTPENLEYVRSRINIYRLQNVETGEIFEGSSKYFKETFGMQTNWLSQLKMGRAKIRGGFRLAPV